MLQRIPFLIMFLALFPVLLPADSPSRPEGVFNVLTFGAKGDGINDDRTAFDRATAAAAAYGPGAELRIPAGRYRIGTLANDAPGKSANLIFSKLKDVAVKGEPGTELIMAGRGHGLMISDCENTVFENLSVDYDPLPFTQGTVEASDSVENTILVRIDPGYRSPLDDAFSGKNIDVLKLRMSFFDDGKRRKDIGINWVASVTPAKDGLVAMKLRNRFDSGLTLKGLKFAMISRSAGTKGHGVFAVNSRACTLKNVDVYSAYNAAYGIRECDRLVMDGCDLDLKPGTDRLISSNADGIHAKFNRGGPIIRNCRITHCEDDCVNIAAGYQRVCEQPSPDTLVIDLDTNARPGDEYVLFDIRTGAEITRVKSTAHERIKWNGVPKYKIKLASELTPGLATVKSTGAPADWRLSIGTGKKLDSTSALPVFLYNLDACGRGAVIDHNVFGYNWPRGILIRAPEAVVSNNRFEDFQGPALVVGHDFVWGEGPNSSGLQILDNVFRDVNRTNIVIEDCALPDKSAGRSIRDILIRGNRFEGFGEASPDGRGRVGEVISVTNGNGVRIENNVFGPPATNIAAPGLPWVSIANSDNVEMKDNTAILKAGSSPQPLPAHRE